MIIAILEEISIKEDTDKDPKYLSTTRVEVKNNVIFLLLMDNRLVFFNQICGVRNNDEDVIVLYQIYRCLEIMFYFLFLAYFKNLVQFKLILLILMKQNQVFQNKKTCIFTNQCPEE